MTFIWVAIACVGVLLAQVVMNLVGDEVKGWIGRLPHGLLWIACRRVPATHRAELHSDWAADLEAKLSDKSDRPITRLIFGVRFAGSLIRGARRVAVELGPIRMGREAANRTLDLSRISDQEIETVLWWLDDHLPGEGSFRLYFVEVDGYGDLRRALVEYDSTFALVTRDGSGPSRSVQLSGDPGEFRRLGLDYHLVEEAPRIRDVSDGPLSR